jgi:putative spermidine/putrescine transport system ATP-binding protein
MAMVELVNISKRYGDAVALSSVDLQIRQGEFLTLLGPSGSGKTTLLNLIAGLIHPSEGQIFIDGKDTTRLPAGQRSIGMVFQNYALMPHMTVFENIAFPLRVRKLPESEINAKVKDVLKLVRLPDIGRRKPKELSGGQQQRVSLARCIVYSPALILMDEPLGALDKKLREQMQLEIKRIHSELGITMLNVTHDQEEALTLSDRIVLMNGGKIEQIDEPTQLYFSPRTVFAADFIGEANFFEGRMCGWQGVQAQVDTACGSLHCLGEQGDARRGDKVTVLVRPENLILAEVPENFATGGASTEAAVNSLRATVVDHLILGGTIKHRVQLPGGKDISVQQANHPGTKVWRRGEQVLIRFAPDSAVLLP